MRTYMFTFAFFFNFIEILQEDQIIGIWHHSQIHFSKLGPCEDDWERLLGDSVRGERGAGAWAL